MKSNRQIAMLGLLITVLSFILFVNLARQNSRLEAAFELDLKDAVSLVQRNAKFVKVGLRGSGGQNRSLHLAEAPKNSTKIIASTLTANSKREAMPITEHDDISAHEQGQQGQRGSVLSWTKGMRHGLRLAQYELQMAMLQATTTVGPGVTTTAGAMQTTAGPFMWLVILLSICCVGMCLCCCCIALKPKEPVGGKLETSASAQTVWRSCFLPMEFEKWDDACEKIADIDGGFKKGGTFTLVGKDGDNLKWTITDMVQDRNVTMHGEGMGGLLKSTWIMRTEPTKDGGCIMVHEVSLYGAIGPFLQFFAQGVMQEGSLSCLKNMKGIAEADNSYSGPPASWVMM